MDETRPGSSVTTGTGIQYYGEHDGEHARKRGKTGAPPVSQSLGLDRIAASHAMACTVWACSISFNRLK